MSPITKTAALRIALAARALDGVEPRAFTLKLAEKLGLPIDEAKLATVTVADLKLLLSGEENVEPDQDRAGLKLAVRYLWGECVNLGDDDADVPKPEPYADGDMPGSLRVAVASNSADRLDGHFGSCTRFLVYQVDREAIRLVDVRPTVIADEAEDKNVARAALIDDCQIVYVQSIGGPAAAKVVRAGIHPVKMPTTAPAPEAIASLRGVFDSPPPWLARVIGVEAGSLSRFADTEEP